MPFCRETSGIFPAVPHTVEQLEGGIDIVIPQLVPGDQLTISYLYPPTFTYNQITGRVRSEDGLAKAVSALPTPQPSRLVVAGVMILLALGAIAALYLMVKVGTALGIYAWR